MPSANVVLEEVGDEVVNIVTSRMTACTVSPGSKEVISRTCANAQETPERAVCIKLNQMMQPATMYFIYHLIRVVLCCLSVAPCSLDMVISVMIAFALHVGKLLNI